MSVDEEIRQRARAALAGLQAHFGTDAGQIMTEPTPVEVVSTGSFGLDRALGVGGIPKGRVVELYGPEGSGTTTLALHAVAEYQKTGGVAAFVDADHAFDRSYAEKLGVNVDELLLSQPDSAEEAHEIVESLVRAKVGFIVVDSVAALIPAALLSCRPLLSSASVCLPSSVLRLRPVAGPSFVVGVGLQARMLAQQLRKLTPVVMAQSCVLIYVNRISVKIGLTFGSPETTTGGRALRFYASVRLEVRRIGGLADRAGYRIRVKVVKNKVAPPHGMAEFDIRLGLGVDRASETLDHGVAAGAIVREGSWYRCVPTPSGPYSEVTLGRGRAQACETLRTTPSLAAHIEAAIVGRWAQYGLPTAPKEVDP